MNRVFYIKQISKYFGINRYYSRSSLILSNLHYIEMPAIMDFKVCTYCHFKHFLIFNSIKQTGIVDKWFKREGETFKGGENLCEVSLGDISVAVESPRSGVVAELLVEKGEEVDVKKHIIAYCFDKDEYFSYIESQRLASVDADMIATSNEVNAELTRKPDTTVLMREIRHLIQNGKISDKGIKVLYIYNITIDYIQKNFLKDFAKKLQTLARKENKVRSHIY